MQLIIMNQSYIYLLHLLYKLRPEPMKVRAYFNSKKNNRTKRPHTTAIETLEEPVMPPTQQQIACHTLMEESWINTHHKQDELRPQPDDFLRVTPRPNERIRYNNLQNEAVKTIQICQNNKIHAKQNINQVSSKKISAISKLLSNKNIVPNFPLECKQKQINEVKNINSKPNMNGSTSFIGKQVLCLTQYIISEPHCDLFAYDNSRKTERSKYLRVLNQMKNRSIIVNNDGASYTNDQGKAKKNMHKSMVFANRKEQAQPNYRIKNAANRQLKSLEKIRLRNNRKLTKQTRNYSLRSSKTNFMAETSYTNRVA